ncbi:MAG: cation:proton antiporter [Caldilineales bacterium]|nr:cation:proton antiporter [Caldilineales bacterium]
MTSIHLLLPLALILVGARLIGRLSQRLGLPGVLGELMAGVLLGPSLLGLIHPNEVISAVADIGVLLLMFIAGLETDLLQLRRLGKASTSAAAAGVILPLLGGLIAGQAFGLSWATSLFLGAALTATSVSVSVQTLQELGRLKSKEGMVTLGAAIIDDVLGILVLSIILAMVGQGGSPLMAMVRIALFFPLALVGGRLLVGPLLRWIDRHHAKEAGFALIVALVLVYAWAAEEWGGLAAITGAYVAGVLVARLPEARSWVTEGASKVGYGLFVPVFFVSVGLATDVRSVMSAPWLSLVVIVVAVITKMFGSGVGARLGGCTWPEAKAVGAGMVARGEVALVMATLGLSSGLLDQTTFGVVILMTLVTTLLTPFLLKFVLPATSSLAAADAAFAPREGLTPALD